MVICATDNRRILNLGKSDVLFSLYSTIKLSVNRDLNDFYHAVQFLETGVCSSKEALVTAREFNLIRDELSKLSPSCAIYDMRDLNRKAPWTDNLSPVVTSCGNMFLTDDGKDLLFEIVSILTYSYYCGSDVVIK